MNALFPQLDEIDLSAARRRLPPRVRLRVSRWRQGIDRVLDYSIPKRLVSRLMIGQRVRVPLGRGNKVTSGYVVSIHPTTEYPKIKPLADLEDERVLVAPKLMALARWMSRYYVTPLGMVLESVIPSAVKKRIGIGYSSVVYPILSSEQLQAAFEQTKAAASGERCSGEVVAA